MDALIQCQLLGSELQVCLFVIRKTYGYNKTQDEISLTQFEQALRASRPTICKAIKNLQLVNILKLVKRGNSKTSSNIYMLNKDYDTWKLVKTLKLVKSKDSTSKVNALQLVKTPKHTKDNTKDNTKDRAQKIALPEWLDQSLWNDYKEHRKNTKAKLTLKAEELAIKKLGKLRASGNDIRAVIEQSIENGWKGLFEIREENNGTRWTGNAKSDTGGINRETADEIERLNEQWRKLHPVSAAGNTR